MLVRTFLGFTVAGQENDVLGQVWISSVRVRLIGKREITIKGKKFIKVFSD